jgi:hypothetical protein
LIGSALKQYLYAVRDKHMQRSRRPELEHLNLHDRGHFQRIRSASTILARPIADA